eukprot:UN01511
MATSQAKKLRSLDFLLILIIVLLFVSLSHSLLIIIIDKNESGYAWVTIPVHSISYVITPGVNSQLFVRHVPRYRSVREILNIDDTTNSALDGVPHSYTANQTQVPNKFTKNQTDCTQKLNNINEVSICGYPHPPVQSVNESNDCFLLSPHPSDPTQIFADSTQSLHLNLILRFCDEIIHNQTKLTLYL